MDLYIFNLINQFAGRWDILDAVTIFFAEYAGYLLIAAVFLIFCLPAVALAKEGKKWKVIIQTFGAAIISRFVITEIIRFLWHRSRPFVENNVNLLLSHDATASFPSGHAAFYFAIAAVVYFHNKKIGLLFFLAAFLISLARVFGGVHWPSDILAGALIGILSAWPVVKLSKRFVNK